MQRTDRVIFFVPTERNCHWLETISGGGRRKCIREQTEGTKIGSISVRGQALHVQSGKQMLFSRVEPRIPSSLYRAEVFVFLEIRSRYGSD